MNSGPRPQMTLAPSSAPAAASRKKVRIEASTWARDSHDLFDFEASQLHTKSLDCSRSSTCVRAGTDIQAVSDNLQLPAGADPLLRVVRKEDNYWVERTVPASSSKKLWMVVKDLPPGNNRLTKGDVIKLGRFKFRVHQTVADESGETQPDLKMASDDGTSSRPCCFPENHEELESMTCRICLLEGSSEEDPLIKPCQCKGSIEHVHLGCLRHWIRGRMNLETTSPAFFYKRLACELCKHPYPIYINGSANQEPVLLAEVPRLPGPFIVLENMARESRGNHQRGLHVVSLSDSKKLMFGRGHESDVRVPDVSISRRHAQIRFQDGHFYIEDLKSKFGTLICTKKPRALDAAHQTSIQVGRTVLTFSMQAAVADNALAGANLGAPSSIGAVSLPPGPPAMLRSPCDAEQPQPGESADFI